MSKRTSHKKQSNPRNKYLAAGLGLVVVVIAAFLAARSATTASPAQHISPAQYQSEFAANSSSYLLLDVRTPDEFASGHIHGAANISVDTLQDHLNEVPRDIPVVVYCHSGNRSAQASRILAQAGYTNIYDLGGINSWIDQGFPVES